MTFSECIKSETNSFPRVRVNYKAIIIRSSNTNNGKQYIMFSERSTCLDWKISLKVLGVWFKLVQFFHLIGACMIERKRSLFVLKLVFKIHKKDEKNINENGTNIKIQRN